MAIQMEALYNRSLKHYEMKVIAGKNGLTNIVSWVHILENVVVKGYVRGNELVFTTGIVYQNNEWLLEFVKGLYQCHASGLVINIGSFIKEVPKEVIDYCDKYNFPLFTVPWHVQLVDITQDYCSQIVKDKQDESSVSSMFKDILLMSGDISSYQQEISGYGFDTKANYCVILIEPILESEHSINDNFKFIKNNMIFILNKYFKKYNIFIHNNQIIIIVSEMDDLKIKELVNEIEYSCKNPQYVFHLQIGIGRNVNSIYSVFQSYQEAQQSLNFAKKSVSSFVFYDDMGVYKALLLIEQKEVLEDIYFETVGKLKRMDQENNTDYVEFLRLYIKFDGNIQKLTDELYVHRNTINYKIKRIKQLIGRDMNKMDDRFQIMFAFKLENIL
ncbi:MAG: PucR family transcriptional regulator [Lachnotalea sp.]